MVNWQKPVKRERAWILADEQRAVQESYRQVQENCKVNIQTNKEASHREHRGHREVKTRGTRCSLPLSGFVANLLFAKHHHQQGLPNITTNKA